MKCNVFKSPEFDNLNQLEDEVEDGDGLGVEVSWEGEGIVRRLLNGHRSTKNVHIFS